MNMHIVFKISISNLPFSSPIKVKYRLRLIIPDTNESHVRDSFIVAQQEADSTNFPTDLFRLFFYYKHVHYILQIWVYRHTLMERTLGIPTRRAIVRDKSRRSRLRKKPTRRIWYLTWRTGVVAWRHRRFRNRNSQRDDFIFSFRFSLNASRGYVSGIEILVGTISGSHDPRKNQIYTDDRLSHIDRPVSTVFFLVDLIGNLYTALAKFPRFRPIKVQAARQRVKVKATSSIRNTNKIFVIQVYHSIVYTFEFYKP